MQKRNKRKKEEQELQLIELGLIKEFKGETNRKLSRRIWKRRKYLLKLLE